MSTDATVHLRIGTDAKVLLRMSADAQVAEGLLDYIIKTPDPLYDWCSPNHYMTAYTN